LSEESPVAGKTEPTRPREPQERFLRLTWEEIQRHFSLTECVRLEGSDLAGQPFWLILQSLEIHWIHVLAYSYRGVIERAPPGATGIISIKPGEWGNFQADLRPDGTARCQCGTSAMEPAWHPGTELKIAIGNIVNYVSGHALLLKAVAGELRFRFIKQWDLPVEFALSAASASTALRAESAQRSVSAEHADSSARAERAELSEESLHAPARHDSIQDLPQGKVQLLRKGGDSTIHILVEGPILLRVFVPDEASQTAPLATRLLAQMARMECLVHIRLRPMDKSTDYSEEGLQVLFFDTASKSMRRENLCQRNVVGMIRLGDGRLVDAVKLREQTDPNAAGGRWMVQIENLAPELNVVVAVWMMDPLLPLLQEGRRVGQGRYTLTRTLGTGGMGVVWLAFDEQLKEFVALKFLPPEVRDDAGALDDLRKETLKSRQLSHPHIVRIHDMHQFEDEPPFISMEYVEGSTLQELRLRQPQRLLAWPQLAPLLEQLCRALEYAHRENVVHRDLKPSNLMVDRMGRLKLADFGIAAAVSDASTQTTPSPIRGTLLYMSPQQLQGQRGRVTDDIYALGAVLYDLLTSKPPFYMGDVAGQVLTATPTPMAERLADLGLNADIPAPVSAVVMSCLEKEPSRRPQSAWAVAKAIGREVMGPSFEEKDGLTTLGLFGGPARWVRSWWKRRSDWAK
jgi:hypothetical protein